MPHSLSAFAVRGPHAVGLRTLDVVDPLDPARRLPTDVWYPANAAAMAGAPAAAPAAHPFGRPHDALEGAPAAEGPFPLVAFSHGNSGLRRQSTFLTTHLASHGFVVAAPDHVGNTFPEMLKLSEEQRKGAHRSIRARRPLDLRAAIDAVLAQAEARGAWEATAWLPRVDVSRIGALGHSFGGWTALKLPRIDARVRVVCGLAPASEPFVGRRAFEPDELPLARGVPALLVAAEDDVLVDIDTSVRPLFARLAGPRALVRVERADHFHFCDGVALLHGVHLATPRPGATRPTLPLDALHDEARMHRLLRGLVAGFFASALQQDAADPTARLDALALAQLDPALRREPGSA